MSLDQAIAHGREHRLGNAERGRSDRTCRPHGGGSPDLQCIYCKNNRLLYRRRFDELMPINRSDLELSRS